MATLLDVTPTEETGATKAGAEAKTPMRVVLIDDHQIVLDGLTAMLRPHRDKVDVVGRARDAEEAVATVRRLEPDLCLLDIRLKATSGLDLCVDLRRRVPACKVVFLTVYDDEQYLFQALQAGASGFLLKQVQGADLVAHLERVMEGEIAIDPALAGRVALSAARLHRGEYWPGAHLGLTQRESEVLGLIVRGLSNRAIAKELIVGEETVKSHVGAIYRKLDVTDRAQAVAAAIREGVYR